MKCDNTPCQKEAPEGRIFCSRECAQSWARHRHDEGMRSVQTGGSRQEAPGGTSAASSSAERPSEPEQEAKRFSQVSVKATRKINGWTEEELSLGRFKPANERTNADGKTQSETQSTTQRGENTMSETEQSTLPMKREGGMPATQPGESTEQLPTSERVEFLPPNSPNELVTELKSTTIELLQDLRKNKEANPAMIDKRLQSICHVAGVTSKFMRLQLDWEKLRHKAGAK